MKRLLLIFLCLCAPLAAQDQWSQTPKAPTGVKYTPLSADRMRKESARVERILAPGYKGKEQLFPTLLVCGPGLWKDWKGLKLPAAVEGIPADFKPGGPGRFFRGKSLKPLEDHLRKTLAADGGFKTRRPTNQELARFWAIIDFDIEEPMIMLESPRRVLLFYGGKMPWLDDYTH